VGDSAVVESLLECKADPECRDANGRHAFHYATESGRLNVCKALMKHGANVLCQDNFRHTPLHCALMFGASSRHRETGAFLLNNGSDACALDMFQRSPLHAAACGGTWTLLDTLLKAGAQLDGRDCQNLTPLHLACRYKNQDMMMELVRRGANATLKDAWGRNALVHCSSEPGLQSCLLRACEDARAMVRAKLVDVFETIYCLKASTVDADVKEAPILLLNTDCIDLLLREVESEILQIDHTTWRYFLAIRDISPWTPLPRGHCSERLLQTMSHWVTLDSDLVE